jgi:hypothetical protein
VRPQRKLAGRSVAGRNVDVGAMWLGRSATVGAMCRGYVSGHEALGGRSAGGCCLLLCRMDG